jgi:hypothetical protein
MSKKKQSLKLPVFLIIGPALGLILSILLYAVINFIIASSTPDVSSSPSISEGASIAQGADGQDLYGDDGSMFKTISNVLLFLLGAGSMLAFVPCLVIGIVMLNKRRNSQVNETPTQHKESRDWGDLE